MQSTEFGAGDWTERLARALGKLSAGQEPYLQEYYRQHPRGHVLFEEQGGKQPAFALDDCRDLYAMAYHSHILGEWKYYAPLSTVLDPARNILRSHPMLARVVSPIIGRDEFWMEILNTGHSTSSGDLIAGLMARAAELSGDRFRTAAGELNAFLDPAPEKRAADGVPGGLDVGYDVVLFYGLTLKERIDIADGMAILPFDQVRTFVDKRLVEELAPQGAEVLWLAVSWGGGQTVPVEARVPTTRLSRGLETEKAGAVFQERAGLPEPSCRGARSAGAIHSSVGPLHRSVRRPAPGSGGLLR